MGTNPRAKEIRVGMEKEGRGGSRTDQPAPPGATRQSTTACCRTRSPARSTPAGQRRFSTGRWQTRRKRPADKGGNARRKATGGARVRSAQAGPPCGRAHARAAGRGRTSSCSFVQDPFDPASAASGDLLFFVVCALCAMLLSSRSASSTLLLLFSMSCASAIRLISFPSSAKSAGGWLGGGWRLRVTGDSGPNSIACTTTGPAAGSVGDLCTSTLLACGRSVGG